MKLLNDFLNLKNRLCKEYKILSLDIPIHICKDSTIYEYKVINNNYCQIEKRKYNYNNIPIAATQVVNNKVGCILSYEFLTKYSHEKLISILFHEAIHYIQAELYDLKLKKNLTINDIKNPMWEINYEFPYNSELFKEWLDEYLILLNHKDILKITEHRKKLKTILDSRDIEFFVWTEWKEGFALYYENIVRRYLNLKNTMTTLPEQLKLNRTAFYITGCKYIEVKYISVPLEDMDVIYDDMII